MAAEAETPIYCSYEIIGRSWVCKIHNRPSKHRIKESSRYPCLTLDPWTVKELDSMHEREGTYDKWRASYKRKEILDKETEKSNDRKRRDQLRQSQ